MKAKGAQPKNTNALKHGFYARRLLTNIERKDVKYMFLQDLTDELVLARVMIRRLGEEMESIEDTETKLKAAACMSDLLKTTATLARTQAVIQSGDDPTNLLAETLREIE